MQRLIRIEDEGAFISLIGKRAAVNPSEKVANIAEHRESRDQRCAVMPRIPLPSTAMPKYCRLCV